MRAVGRLEDDLLGLHVVARHFLAGRRVDPANLVAVLLDPHLDGPRRLLDVDDVLDAGQGDGASPVEVEVGLEFPVAGFVEER